MRCFFGLPRLFRLELWVKRPSNPTRKPPRIPVTEAENQLGGWVTGEAYKTEGNRHNGPDRGFRDLRR